MVRFIVTVASEPAKRLTFFYQATAWSVTVVSMWIGAGYAVGGSKATSGTALKLVANILPGGVRTHGFILFGLGLLLASGLPEFRRRTHVALIALLFYSLLTALLVAMNFFFASISWAAPAWYSFLAFTALLLVALAPDLPACREGRSVSPHSEPTRN